MELVQDQTHLQLLWETKFRDRLKIDQLPLQPWVQMLIVDLLSQILIHCPTHGAVLLQLVVGQTILQESIVPVVQMCLVLVTLARMLSGIDSRSGGLIDPSTMIQLLQNPAVSQMMNQLVDMDPQLSGMVDSNPEVQEALQNPESLLSELASLERLQQAMDFHLCLVHSHCSHLSELVRLGGEQCHLKNFMQINFPSTKKWV